jgi:uncharacterized membrane protein
VGAGDSVTSNNLFGIVAHEVYGAAGLITGMVGLTPIEVVVGVVALVVLVVLVQFVRALFDKQGWTLHDS